MSSTVKLVLDGVYGLRQHESGDYLAARAAVREGEASGFRAMVDGMPAAMEVRERDTWLAVGTSAGPLVVLHVEYLDIPSGEALHTVELAMSIEAVRHLARVENVARAEMLHDGELPLLVIDEAGETVLYARHANVLASLAPAENACAALASLAPAD